MSLLALTLVLGAAPTFEVERGLEPQKLLVREATSAWEGLEQSWRRATQQAVAAPPPVELRTGPLPSGHGGRSRLGALWLRQRTPGKLGDDERVMLRHEVAHQFLFAACPRSATDALFHEAFAVAQSGELSAWAAEGYLSLSSARALLSQQRSLDTRPARRALSRLLAESQTPGSPLPVALLRRARGCADGGRWEALTVSELEAALREKGQDAVVAVHRLSGEVVYSEGDVDLPQPFGSTLKPFVVAGATSTPPLLPARAEVPEWLCGEQLPSPLGPREALLRSCNGYFLDWGAKDKEAARFGALGPLLLSAGLPRLPDDMSEAIGVRATLRLSALQLARAYRVLAEARPDVLQWLEGNAEEGTLGGLSSSRALSGVATKTGTVRDGESRPLWGWTVAVTSELVVVVVRSGKMPRSFAGEVVAALARAEQAPGLRPATVQAFGLLEPSTVEVWCPSGGFRVAKGELVPLAAGFLPLREAAQQGRALCVSGPFLARFPGLRAPSRPYAGVFSRSPPPPYRSTEVGLSERARRARQGSEFLFHTSLGLYAAGVLAAEDAAIEGEARSALLRVAAHNQGHSRHPGRPVCDTTHCQAFLGTFALRRGDAQALFRERLPWSEWLHFSRGGLEPWREVRTRAQVEAALGVSSLEAVEMRGPWVTVRRRVVEGEAHYEASERLSCERLRGPLKLPSCPTKVSGPRGEKELVFEGLGQGHGLGLDVERAKASGLGQDDLLDAAYGQLTGRSR